MCKVVGFLNSKGGVGKTTLNFHLAHYLNEKGFKVLAIDLESPYSLNNLFSFDDSVVSTNSNVIDLFYLNDYYPVISRSDCGVDLLLHSGDLCRVDALGVDALFAFKSNIALLRKNYDYIIIDTPPTLSVRLDCALVSSDFIISPVVPDKVGVEGFISFLDKYKLIRERLNNSLDLMPLVVINLFRSRNAEHRSMIDELFSIYTDDYNSRFVIKNSSCVQNMLKDNLPVWKSKTNNEFKSNFLSFFNFVFNYIA